MSPAWGQDLFSQQTFYSCGLSRQWGWPDEPKQTGTERISEEKDRGEAHQADLAHTWPRFQGRDLALFSSGSVPVSSGGRGGCVISLGNRLETLYSVLGRCPISHPSGHPGTWDLDHLESHWREMSEASPRFNDKYSSFTSWLLHGQREVWIRREMTSYPRCAWL